MAARLFFPQAQALGLGIDEELSPSMLERVTYLGTKLPSFRDAYEAMNKILRTTINEKRVERTTERIGGERVAQRQEQISAWSELKMTEKIVAPPGVKPPDVVSVMADGGRLQLRDPNPDAKSHWHEYKCGLLQSLSSEVSASDPCPQIPDFFLNRERMDKLAREITHVAARIESPVDKPVPDAQSTSEISAIVLGTEEERGSIDYQPPKVIDREVVASRQESRTFGRHLAAVAWSLGFLAAKQKAFVGDWSELDLDGMGTPFQTLWLRPHPRLYSRINARLRRSNGWAPGGARLARLCSLDHRRLEWRHHIGHF